MTSPYPVDRNGIIEWFSQFGNTDQRYFLAHYDRWIGTKNFALGDSAVAGPLRILDAGAHWLHNAYLYAIDGHELICMDAPDTLGMTSVKDVAGHFGMQLVPTRRMETGDGLELVADDSVDLVLFCEIIEHLTFNPIPFWKEIYRILRPGGRIIITTPNSFYHRNLDQHFHDMMAGQRIGISLDEIMQHGTYGHHWKEFSLAELQRYFCHMSPDFRNARHTMVELDGDKHVLLSDIAKSISEMTNVRAYNIYLEVVLPEKNAGIVVSPPWIPMGNP